mmetsp:Transcript_102587/g.203633  ORF Transcript_102587/g.203633 Transcript_102587/m.203633 type:complete len:415 (+) Transcript_102587:127-1371(+)
MAFADAVATQVRALLELDEDGQRAALAALAARGTGSGGGCGEGPMLSQTYAQASGPTVVVPSPGMEVSSPAPADAPSPLMQVAKVPLPAAPMPSTGAVALQKVVEELTTRLPPPALPLLPKLLTALAVQPAQGRLQSQSPLPSFTGDEAVVARWLSHELQRQQQQSARRLLTDMAATVGNMAADAAALAAARQLPQGEANMAQSWCHTGHQFDCRANMASTKSNSGIGPLPKAQARPAATAVWPVQAQGTALHQADPPKKPPADTLRAHLQSLVKIDSGRIIIVRKINRLGFASPSVLTAHYSRVGIVDRVLVAHSRVKHACQWKVEPSDAQRLRPSGLGFVVMSKVSEAEAIFAQGVEQMVGGTVIRIQRFERRATHEVEEEDNSETAVPETGSEGRVGNTSSSEDNNSGHEA